eukprot:g57567.t1
MYKTGQYVMHVYIYSIPLVRANSWRRTDSGRDLQLQTQRYQHRHGPVRNRYLQDLIAYGFGTQRVEGEVSALVAGDLTLGAIHHTDVEWITQADTFQQWINSKVSYSNIGECRLSCALSETCESISIRKRDCRCFEVVTGGPLPDEQFTTYFIRPLYSDANQWLITCFISAVMDMVLVQPFVILVLSLLQYIPMRKVKDLNLDHIVVEDYRNSRPSVPVGASGVVKEVESEDAVLLGMVEKDLVQQSLSMNSIALDKNVEMETLDGSYRVGGLPVVPEAAATEQRPESKQTFVDLSPDVVRISKEGEITQEAALWEGERHVRPSTVSATEPATVHSRSPSSNNNTRRIAADSSSSPANTTRRVAAGNTRRVSPANPTRRVESSVSSHISPPSVNSRRVAEQESKLAQLSNSARKIAPMADNLPVSPSSTNNSPGANAPELSCVPFPVLEESEGSGSADLVPRKIRQASPVQDSQDPLFLDHSRQRFSKVSPSIFEKGRIAVAFTSALPVRSNATVTKFGNMKFPNARSRWIHVDSYRYDILLISDITL